ARLKGDESSELWVRTQIPSTNSSSKVPTTGFEVDLHEPADSGKPRTGSIWAVTPKPEGGRSVNGYSRMDPMVQPGRWFTLEVVAQGNQVYVLVNGELAHDTNWVKRDQYESGRIAIEQLAGEPSIEFRTIEIKELESLPTAAIAREPEDKNALIAPFDESAAKTAQQQWSDRLHLPVEPQNTIGIRLQLIPPGQFIMGSDHSAPHVAPAHSVRITRPYYLGRFEVTRGQFAKFVTATHFKTRGEQKPGGWRLDNSDKKVVHESKKHYTWRKPGFTQDDRHPVVNVDYDDIHAFCDWLSSKEGQKYRLPTEAEWEYACRAGTSGEYYLGKKSEDLPQIGNFPDADARSKFPAWTSNITGSDGYTYTSPVGQFRPNNFGLYDMLGNVMEWCSDWHDGEYYRNSPVDDPPGAATGKSRAARGGSFAAQAEASARWYKVPDHRFPDCGFRVVREIPFAPSLAEMTPAGPPGDRRHAWVGDSSRFDNIANGKWRETFPEPGHALYFFDEVRRTAEQIELLDKSRIREQGGVSVRLGADQALIRWGGPDQEFKLLQRGHWATDQDAPGTPDSAKTGTRRPVDSSRSNTFFNGKNLAGWEGLKGFWQVEDHALVGRVPEGAKSAHTFLCSKREFSDFEVRFRARLAGGVGNSGFQFRSKFRDPKTFWLVGPQCEICVQDRNRKYPTGSLVTEPTGEPSLAPVAADVDRIFKLADFNDFEIRCVGKHVRIKVNGLTTVDADFPSMLDEGFIGWQMHGKNPPREVTFKDIEFTNLSAAPAPAAGP
ncbi:MAG TPA: SUMF1/EgtB/PvdO family nonheme iron enzyme, partial [Planctomycetaceae bacterium]|nr:SUMF1/EgtB/PvdO family nonheme iron enzyme [Planctomycetaceae bacterium]